MLARVEALESGQIKQQEKIEIHGTDIKNICANVERMANSMEKLTDIIPVITLAQSVRNVSVWVAPIFAAIAAMSAGVYWVLEKFHG